jgi:hypothetical protein
MPTPAVTLKLRRFRRRFGIAAPRLVVKSHLPWQWYLVMQALLVGVTALGVWWLLRHEELNSLDRELVMLRERVAQQGDELIVLRASAGTEKSAVQMERATQQQLLQRIKLLEMENSALREDVMLFERLVPAQEGDGSVKVENFRLVEDASRQVRYRLLLAYQASKQLPEFRGRLQFEVHFVLAGKEEKLIVPSADNKTQKGFQIELKHFLRKEGVIDLPLGGRLKSVEVQIWVGDSLRAKRLAQL